MVANKYIVYKKVKALKKKLLLKNFKKILRKTFQIYIFFNTET